MQKTEQQFMEQLFEAINGIPSYQFDRQAKFYRKRAVKCVADYMYLVDKEWTEEEKRQWYGEYIKFMDWFNKKRCLSQRRGSF